MKTNILVDKLNEFRVYMYQDEKSKATMEKYTRDIKYFIEHVKTKKNINKIDVIEYKNYLKEDYKISSINSMLVAVNKFMEFMGKADLKVRLIKQQKQIFLKEELTKEEYRRLILIADKKKKTRLSMIMQTIGSTGVRISELKYITLEGVKIGHISVYLKGKNRVILIPKALKIKLVKYCKENKILSGMIFVTKGNKVVNRSNIWKEMKSLCIEAEVQENKIFPHNLRHLFAIVYYNLKKDIVRLSDILGHSSIETTRIYTKVSKNDCKRTLEKMDMVST